MITIVLIFQVKKNTVKLSKVSIFENISKLLKSNVVFVVELFLETKDL